MRNVGNVRDVERFDIYETCGSLGKKALHITNFLWQRISFTEVTVFIFYTILSKQNSCTLIHLINS